MKDNRELPFIEDLDDRTPENDDGILGTPFGAYETGDDDKNENIPEEAFDDVSVLDGSRREGGYGAAESTAKKVALKLAPFIIMLVFLVYWFGDMVNFGGGKTQAPDVSNLEMENERYKQLLAEREEMARRLAIGEAQTQAEREDMARRMAALLEEMKKAEAERIRQLKEQEERLRAEMERLLANIKPQEVIVREVPVEKKTQPEPPMKTEPLKGSSTSTRTFDMVAAMKQRQADEEARLAKVVETSIARPQPGLGTARAIRAKLDTKMVSLYSNNLAWTVATTTEEIDMGNGFFLPAGVKFIGKATPDFDARRMTVELTRVQRGDAELPFSGTLLDKHGNAGLVTRYIDAKNQAMWAGIIPNLLSVGARAAQEMRTDVFYDSNGRRSTERRPKYTKENIALEGAAQTAEDIAAYIREAAAEKKNIIIVDAGIDVIVQTAEKIPMENLIESGIVERRARTRY